MAGSFWEAAAVVERLGGGGTVVVVLQLLSSCSSGSNSPWCARAVHRQSAGHFSCAQRGTHSANCAEDCSCVDVPVISSDKFPLSRGLNPLAPDSVHPLSGEHSCCATAFVVFHRCSSWTRWRSARCCDDRCSSWCSGKLLTCPYMYNDRCRVHGGNSLFST